ncbi:MAG TPA: PepSY domain-containing protein [Rubrivivax sp.]|nr:PepSY domain-containing protein [Burkholderiales bacterium]HNT39680.1 PepSY domain-containing protein [Rubrivivax sp.]
MNTPRRFAKPFVRRFALPLILTLAAAPTLAADDCAVPLAQWQPREAVRQKAAAQGWKLERLKVDDGCYDVRGRDETGRAFKAKLDPHTLEIVKMKWRQRERRARR